jgi:hypothetical protein
MTEVSILWAKAEQSAIVSGGGGGGGGNNRSTAHQFVISDPDWRTRHCAEPAADRIRDATGRDVWRELGGVPRSPKEAAAIFRRLKVRSLKGAVTKLLGKPIDPKLAMRGDIAMVDNALGIVRGEWIECVDRMQPIGRASAPGA